jgi:hypothetical protein
LQGSQGRQGTQGLSIQGTQGIAGSGGGTSNWVRKTTTYTAVTGDKIIADTSGGAFTITLPATPSIGDNVIFADGASWNTSNLTVARNGSTIEGYVDDFILNIAGIEVSFIYDGTTWEVYANVGPKGTQGTAGSGGGGSGTFDVGITSSVYVSVTSGIATGIGGGGITTANSQLYRNNDIFIGPGIGFSFPSTAGNDYVVESIHVTNIFSNELYLSARQDYFQSSNNWLNIPIAQRVIVPYQGSAELLEQPIIASPQDILRFQALAGVGTTAAGVDGGLDAFITYSTKTDTNYVGVGSTVASSTGAEVYRSTTYPSVIQSIRLINYNLSIDIDASVSIYRGGTAGGIVTTGVRQGYLAYNLTVPKNSTIELCDKPKYLNVNDTIVAFGSTINSLAVCVSGKKIV